MNAAPQLISCGSPKNITNNVALIDVKTCCNTHQVKMQCRNPAEDLKQFVSLLMELSVLDESLAILFKDPPNAEKVDHHVLVQFRGRVARRVTRYSPLIKKCCALSDMLPCGVIRNEAKNEYEKHVLQLQEYKNQLSVWWSKTERSFHMKSMASLVSDMEMAKNLA